MKTNKSPRYLYNLLPLQNQLAHHKVIQQYNLFSLQTIYPVFTSNITFFSKSLSTFKKSILQIIRPSPSSTYNCDIITRELNTLPDYVLDYVLIQCAVAEWILTQLVIVYSIASIFQMTDLLT